MWIEKRGQQHRVYWRNRAETGPKKSFEPFGTRDQAELFHQLARASSLTGALAYVRNPGDEALMALLGRQPVPGPAETSTASQAVAGVAGSTSGVGDRYDPGSVSRSRTCGGASWTASGSSRRPPSTSTRVTAAPTCCRSSTRSTWA